MKRLPEYEALDGRRAERLRYSQKNEKKAMKRKRSAKIWAVLAEWGVITLGTAIVAAAVFFFLVPSRLSVGSVSGLAIVLANFIPLPVSAITMALNVLFLVLGFLLIGGEFGAKTVYTSILLPLLLGVLERLFPNNGSIMGDQFLDMLCYTMLVSLGLALLFVRNASSGGLDIAAKILNRYFHLELGAALAAAGMVVALSSALVYDANRRAQRYRYISGRHCAGPFHLWHEHKEKGVHLIGPH